MKPQIVKESRDANGKPIKKLEPYVVRSVMTKQTSDALKNLLGGNVLRGTAKNAQVQGYRIAGSVGISETTEEGIYIASFAGFAATDNPKFVCIMTLNGPSGYDATGQEIASPVGGKLIKDIWDYMD